MTLMTIVSYMESKELCQPVMINVYSSTLNDDTTTSVLSESVPQLQDASWTQKRVHLSTNHDSRAFGSRSLLKQKLQVVLMTACHRVQM